jgi:hypothetical protein
VMMAAMNQRDGCGRAVTFLAESGMRDGKPTA